MLKPGLKSGLVLLATSLTILSVWLLYDEISTPGMSPQRVEDGAAFSVIPLGASALLFVFGVVRVATALLNRR